MESRGQKIIDRLPLAVLLFLGSWVWLSQQLQPKHQPVGFYIGVLAFVAAVVTIWPPEHAWAKAGWIIIFGGFLVLEITTLYQQRKEDADTADDNRVAEDNRFANVLKSQQESFARVLKQNQKQFDATIGEVRGSAGYVWFLALARDTGDLPVMMGNENKSPVRGVDLEIITIPPKESPNRDQQIANSVFNPRLVHLGDVGPGFKEAPFALAPGNYNIRIITRLGVFDERIKALRGPGVPDGWQEKSCILRNNSSVVLRGECP